MWDLVRSHLEAPLPGIGWAATVLRLGSALLLGGIVGFEREHQSKHAGLRTHILIALAACLFTLIMLGMLANPATDDDSIRKDPIRVIEAVTAGVAFLAAGTIFVSGQDVKGLTTGAGMWLAGAIGVTCGMGHLGLAILATVLAVVVLWLVKVTVKRDDAA